MKKYITLRNTGIALCIIGILLVLVNWMTGIINPIMTSGASVICLTSFITTLNVLINYTNSSTQSKFHRNNKNEKA